MNPLSLIDISHWEDVEDWKTLKQQVVGVYTKATQGTTFVDPKLAKFVSAANAARVPIGIYHVIECSKDIQAQVDFFMKQVRICGSILRVALDFETEVNKATSAKQNKAACLDFIARLTKAIGYKPIFYCNTGDLKAMQFATSEASAFDMWLANYNAKTLPGPVAGVNKYLMWQHSDSYNVPGAGKVDHNWLYGTLDDLLVKPAKQPQPVPVKPTSDYSSKLLALAKQVNCTELAQHLLDVMAGKQPDRVTLFDVSLNPDKRRLHVVDMLRASVTSITCAVGTGTAATRMDPASTYKFSNARGSNQTSLGAFKYDAKTYVGKHGVSLRMIGLEATNNNMLERAVVLHTAEYVTPDFAGRSNGCQAIAKDYAYIIPSLAGCYGAIGFGDK